MDPYIIVTSILNILFVSAVYMLIPKYVPEEKRVNYLTWLPLAYSTLHLSIDILFSQSKKFAIFFVLIGAGLFFISLFVIIPKYSGKAKESPTDDEVTDLIFVSNVIIAIMYIFLSKDLRKQYKLVSTIGSR